MDEKQPILRIRDLSTCFRTDRGVVTAVDRLSFDVYPGETLGIVGESGCGKTVASKSIMRLLPEHLSFFKPESRIEFNGQNLAFADERHLRTVRGNDIAMIFQEPMTALNPVFTVGWQLDEALKYHTKLDKPGRRARAIEMLDLVKMPNPERRLREYPHQLSGGMRQRVMIAMALCCEPDVLIADEPTTALDVTIQAQILRLMEDLKQKVGTAIILITHDLGVVAQVCDRVLVMYAGQVVETAPVGELFHNPKHPYTRALLDSLPKAGVHTPRLAAIDGIVPSLWNLPSGCRFSDRCEFCETKCREDEPQLEPNHNPDEPADSNSASAWGRSVRCHFPLQKN